MVLPRSSQWQRNAAGVHRTMARGSLPGAGRRTRSLSGHPWAETWGRPASEFPSLPSCPLRAPARRPHLAPGGSRPASPPLSAPRPWPCAAAPRPPAPFPEPPQGGQATPLRLPPPAPHRGPRLGGRPQEKCTKKPSWVTVPSLPQGLLLFLAPPVSPSVSLPWWVGAEPLSFYVAETSREFEAILLPQLPCCWAVAFLWITQCSLFFPTEASLLQSLVSQTKAESKPAREVLVPLPTRRTWHKASLFSFLVACFLHKVAEKGLISSS